MSKNILVIFVVILVLGACKSTKYVPENSYLLSDVRIESKNLDLNTAELKSYLKQSPNLKILGLFKFHLGLYNMSGSNLDKWWNRWFRRIGEEPVVYDKYLTDRSRDEILKYMHNKGFLYATVKDTTIFNNNTMKAKVLFNVMPKKAFTIIEHHKNIKDKNIKSLIDADSLNSYIKEGSNFDIDELNKERDRIARLLRTNGYYNFSRDYIHYVADSSQKAFSIVDTLVLKNPTRINALNQRVETPHLQYTIRDVYIITDFDPQQAIKQQQKYYESFDTVDYEGFKILYRDELHIKPVILKINNLIYPNALYNYKNVERTHALLASIPIIKYVNIRFAENPTIEPTLDCYIQITQSESMDYSINIEGTNQPDIGGTGGTNINIGAAINLNYTHRNLFRGGEMYNAKFSYGRETQSSLEDDRNFNSDEFGFESSLLYPRFLFPFLSKKVYDNFKSNTNFKMAYNYQDRPDYNRHIAGVGMQYRWKGKSNWSHTFDILDLSYISVFDESQAFLDYVEGTFLRYSYQDHVILGMGYKLTYSDQNTKNFRDSRFLRLGLESSGNTLYGINNLTGAKKNSDGSYEFVGVNYSQYVKFDFEGIFNRRIDPKNTIVYHASIGVGVPYGNVNDLPFEKRYFGGGANGVRGWQVRSLGPGVYKAEEVDYLNQSGDIRLLANVEYRFKLIWVVEGALFSDVGNIWTINNKTSQPGGYFQINNFYKQLAMAYGIGARFDFSFFVFRLDLGIKGYDPVRETPNRWVSSPSFSQDMTLHLAINYPF